MIPYSAIWEAAQTHRSLRSLDVVRATLVAMVGAGALPAQDGQLVSQGDEFELQGEATTNPEREQGTEAGQKREHADDGMVAARNIRLTISEVWRPLDPNHEACLATVQIASHVRAIWSCKQS